jgi:hypothetical protein
VSDQPSTTQRTARRGYAVIDQADRVDVTSYDSFPASDPPSWIATGAGPPYQGEADRPDSTPAREVAHRPTLDRRIAPVDTVAAGDERGLVGQ